MHQDLISIQSNFFSPLFEGLGNFSMPSSFICATFQKAWRLLTGLFNASSEISLSKTKLFYCKKKKIMFEMLILLNLSFLLIP